MAQVVPLRTRVGPASSTSTATPRDILVGRLREALGRLLNRAGMPGAIRPMHIHDELTGMDIEIRVSPWFTVVSIDGRDFYFRRLSGDLDGTGSMTCG